MNHGQLADVPIRDAASVILLRRCATGAPRVLMGMRSPRAVFMPSRHVFPGGAVDPGDDAPGTEADPRLNLAPRTAHPVSAGALIGCARRELEEETGLVLQPHCTFRFLFRAITPPGRPRRFDARFLAVDSTEIEGDPDDFSHACDELSGLQWLSLDRARQLDLAFITEVVLAEAAALLDSAGSGPLPRPATVPFFDNSGTVSRFAHIS